MDVRYIPLTHGAFVAPFRKVVSVGGLYFQSQSIPGLCNLDTVILVLDPPTRLSLAYLDYPPCTSRSRWTTQWRNNANPGYQ